MDRMSLESFLARGLSLAEIGRRVGRHESTVGHWVRKYGLEPACSGRYAARGALTEGELQRLIEEGMTIAQIAVAVERSRSTVRHWLTRYGLKTQHSRGRRASSAAQAAKREGLATVTMSCPRHGVTEFWLASRGYYRCKQCRSDAVVRRRRKVKAILVAEAGGCCCLCGYARSMRALHFHHLDPRSKRHEINAKGVAVAIEKLRAEARKCVLLCSNCHAEVEDGIRSTPSSTALNSSAG
jgi:transposase